MARIAGSNGPRTAAQIRRAALKLITRHGYEAMSLRALAADVGIQAASLYNHIKTKQDLLYQIIAEHLDALMQSADVAVAQAGADPVARLRAFIGHHLLYHLDKRQEVFIANFELRALEPANLAKAVAQRRAYEERLIRLIEDGIAQAALKPTDTRIAAYAMLAMLTGACTWFRPDGRLSKAELVQLHTDLILNGCAA
ncbi:MAG: TetR/AcrR family transcriptional regulator [Acetobacteraceae bacterium]|nr:TetR/AcrR family transcriptional regulator [Acetobacteraceae bacterium]